VLAELRMRGLLGDVVGDYRRPIFEAVQDQREAEDRLWRIARARQIWDRARDARGSLAERYLASRGLILPDTPVLRYAASCQHPSAVSLPAMVARVDSLDGQLIGVHRTYLTRDHRRRDRASLGPIGGGAVRLAQASEQLMVAEGIENALAAMQVCPLPAWAALSACGIEALLLPAMVRTVIILADNDHNGRGEQAARTAAERWLAEGRRVRIAMPPRPGTDFNDLLVGRGHADGGDVAS
jgi:putative DNA primase/helicase